MTTSQTRVDFLLRRIPKGHGLREFTVEDDPRGCWIAKRRGSNGYAYNTSFEGKKANAYRLIYELVVGPVPEGLELDHICDNGPGGCVNPDHLKPTTKRVNILRSSNPCAQKARQTHCKHGHEFTPENTRIVWRSNGYYSRFCLTCAEKTNRAYKERHSKDELNAKRREHYARKREEILAVKREKNRRKKLGLPIGRDTYDDIKGAG